MVHGLLVLLVCSTSTPAKSVYEMSYKRQSLITDVRPPSASSTAARLISLHGILEAALENQSDDGDALAALAALHAVPFVTAAALRAADGVAKTVGQLRRHPSTRLATAAREVRVAGQWAKNMGWTQKRSQSITPTPPLFCLQSFGFDAR